MIPIGTRIRMACVACAILALAWWACSPGLSGGFLFDDLVNLNALGQFGRVDNLRTLAYYLTVGLGDPLGRPLSMLSFLADARDWPADPAPFLRTNLVLHLVNTVLLAAVLLGLTAERDEHSMRARMAALIACAFWALHPLFLSTTLYIVQRESMLVATWVLLGFLCWISGRRQLRHDHATIGCSLLVIGSLGCTLLAMLCKANGALLPLLLLVAEATILPPLTPAAAERRLGRIRIAVLVLPTVGLVAVLAAMLPSSIAGALTTRPWTLGERLLTEPRVVMDYLRLLLLPRSLTAGLFQDDFPVSTDLFHPWTTLASLVGLAAFGAAAWGQRRKWPLLSFAVLFFLAGHALEGSVIALELYFEHRNYVPAMPLFWPLARWLAATGALQRTRALTAAAMVLSLACCSRWGSTIWGQPERLAYAWAANAPDSARAQAYAAQFEMRVGENTAAARRLRLALSRTPDDAQLAFNLADAECALGGIRADTTAALLKSIANSKNTAKLGFDWITARIPRAHEGTCTGLDMALLRAMVRAARANPAFKGVAAREHDFLHMEGLIDIAEGDPWGAFEAFERGVDELPRAGAVLNQAALLGSIGRPDLGLDHLRKFESLPRVERHPWPTMANVNEWLLQRWGYWDNELAVLQTRLAEDAANMHDAGSRQEPPAR